MEISHAEFLQNVWKFVGYVESSLMTLCELGFIMYQYGSTSEFPNSFHGCLPYWIQTKSEKFMGYTEKSVHSLM